ncbi:unnamed protein product [Heterobilharzia americana]|nr:unnamed protein product [Heterobilharzia americana]
MPPSQFHKPETALTKARELIKCDKKANALEILYDVMRVRRAKQWQKVLEELMMLFVELCVELRKNIHFRKAIYQYKNMSIMENTVSLEQVIRYYLSQIKSRTEEAQQESKSAIMDIEDLDILETPESLMLNAVSMEGTQDRSARTILMPWLKFLWDSYRLVLDLLRSNSKLESLYHEVAHDGLLQVPTRQSLIRELVRHKIYTIVPTDLAKLYQVLEADFQPLKLWELVQPSLEYMAKFSDLKVYTTQLHDVIVAKTLLQLSQVYQSLNFEEFVKLCPFMEPIRLERSVIELIHNLELPIRVNHLLQAIFFDKFTDLGISQCEYGGQLVSQSTHVNDPDKLSRQLTMFAQVMQQITDILEVDQSLANCRRVLVHEYRRNEHMLHTELLNRRYLIEARKEEVETYQDKRDQYYSTVEAQRHAEQQRLLKAEETNLVNEAMQRERLKTEDEKNRLKLRMARTSLKMFLDLKIDTKLDLKELTEEQLENFDADKLINRQKQEVKKKRKEIAEKAKTMAKKLDYYTRACRLEEIPLLQANIEPEAIQARELFEQSTREIEEHSKAEHARQLKERNRLIRMKSDVQRLVSQLKEARDNRYKAKLAEWEALCDQTRSERLADLKAKRDAEAEAEAHRRAAEEEKEREAQKQRELAAEAERIKREQEAKEAAEREAARREEESKAWIRGEVKKEEPMAGTDFGRTRTSEVIENRDFRRDDPPKVVDFGWSRGNKRIGFENTPSHRGASDFGSRGDQQSWVRSGPRKTMPTEFEAAIHEEDTSGGGWTSVGSRRESERTRSFGRGGGTMGAFNRGFKGPDTDTSSSSTPWRREGPNAAMNTSAAFDETRGGGGMRRPFGGVGFPSRLSNTISENRKN